MDLQPTGATSTVVTRKESKQDQALEQLFQVFSVAEEKLTATGAKTEEQFKNFMVKVQEQFTVLSEENRQLRGQLVAQQGRERELEKLHQAEVSLLEGRVESSEKAVSTMRQEMLESIKNAEERVAVAMKEQRLAVEAAKKAGDDLVASAKAEASLAVQENARYKEKVRRAHDAAAYLDINMSSALKCYNPKRVCNIECDFKWLWTNINEYRTSQLEQLISLLKE